MNRWASMLSELPAELQRLIARSQRISLPRRHDAAERVRRLRTAMCHAATVRVTYQRLNASEQVALQELRAMHGGIVEHELVRRFGSLRSVAQIVADRQPRSVAEQLLLLGWLLPRPGGAPGLRRFMLPPELRTWLPQPLSLVPHGAAPPMEYPLALRCAATLIVASAQHPLATCADTRLCRASLRILARRLAPLPADTIAALCLFTMPLLAELGLVAQGPQGWSPSPAASHFLALPSAEQLTRLHDAWRRSPTRDAWLKPLAPRMDDLSLPVLREKLVQWIDALPAGQRFVVGELYPALAAAFGPLGDAHTHGWRSPWIGRVPWQPRRAAAVFDAALREPLRWLGLVGWNEQQPHEVYVFRPVPAPNATAPAWHYASPGLVCVPHSAADADVLRILPFVTWHVADVAATSYRVTPATLAAARRRGLSASTLWALLEHRAGTTPSGWRDGLAGPIARVRIVHTAIAVADPPAALDRVAADRTVRRRIATRVAPGVALVEPADVAALMRALEQRGIATLPEGAPPSRPAAPLSPHQSASLLLACAFYRRHAPPDAPLLPPDLLEERLRAELTPALRAALDTALDAIDAQLDPPSPPTPTEPLPAMPNAAVVRCLNQARARHQDVEISYDKGGEGQWSLRVVRPLELEWRNSELYLRAFCTLRQAERTFRVDRIGAARPLKQSKREQAPVDSR